MIALVLCQKDPKVCNFIYSLIRVFYNVTNNDYNSCNNISLRHSFKQFATNVHIPILGIHSYKTNAHLAYNEHQFKNTLIVNFPANMCTSKNPTDIKKICGKHVFFNHTKNLLTTYQRRTTIAELHGSSPQATPFSLKWRWNQQISPTG